MREKGAASVDPEKVEIVEVFENDIELYLHIWADKNGFKNIAKEVTPRQWNNALRFIYKNVFEPKEKRRLLKLKAGEIIFNESNPRCNCQAFNIDMVLSIYNIYMDMCNLYNKDISIYGFKLMTNISYTELDNMFNKNRVSKSNIDIIKRIKEDRLESLKGSVTEKGSNTLGYITILNNEYNWSTQNVKTEHINPSLSAEELPQLGGNSVKALSDTQKSDENGV